MGKNGKERKKEIEAIFKRYNGSAVTYIPRKKSCKKSIAEICSSGSTLAKGTSVMDLINEIRK